MNAFPTDSGRRPLRTLPRLVINSLRIAWHAGPRHFAIAVGLQVFAASATVLQLLLIRDVLATIFAPDAATQDFNSGVYWKFLLLAAITAGINFATVLQHEYQRLLGELVRSYAEDRVQRVASVVDLKTFESPVFQDQVQRALTGAGFRPWQMTLGLLGLFNTLFVMAGIIFALLAIQPFLVSLVLVAYIPLWFATTQASRDYYMLSSRLTPTERKRAYLMKVLTGREEAKEVRAFGLAPFLGGRYASLRDERIREICNLIRKRGRLVMLGTFVSTVMTGGAIVGLAYLVARGSMGPGPAGAAAAATLMLAQNLENVGFSAALMYESALFIDDFTSFVQHLRQPNPSRTLTRAPGEFASIAAEDVTFTYPGNQEPALTDISLEINRGEIVALVGENGSGKTTLAKLLCHLYVPDSGRITWNAVDMTDLDPDELRRSIAAIFQNFVRYSFSAQENIGIGQHERHDDFEGIVRAAQQAEAHDVIAALPSGYATVLGPEFEGGVDISIGQWQRVALARAFFRDAPFIILDEPTAALDARAEHGFFERVRQLARGRSVLLISHRFANVRSAERIYVLKQGRIVEQGTHDQLMELNGLYAELFTLQSAAYVTPVETECGPAGSLPNRRVSSALVI